MNDENEEPYDYDYIIKFDTFQNLFNNKKLNYKTISKGGEIFSSLYYCIGIKGSNLSLQTKFINFLQGSNFSSQRDKDDILFLGYFNFNENQKKIDLYLFINYIDDLIIPDNLDEDEYKILKDLTNKFLINFSDIFILLIDEDEQINEQYKKKIINEIINSTEKKKFLIIHAVTEQNIGKIRQSLNNKDKYKIKGSYKRKNHEYVNKNNSNVTHLIYHKENNSCKENDNILNFLEQIIKKNKIRNENFYDKYYDFIMSHVSEKYNINKGIETPKKKKLMKKLSFSSKNSDFNDSYTKYDYILYFKSFLNFIDDKKFIIQNNFNDSISLQSKIINCLCIKGSNIKLQTKFINEYSKLNFSDNKKEDEKLFLNYLKENNNLILLINYEEKYNQYIINKNLLKDYELSEIIEDQIISMNFINFFLDKLSELYILILDENENEEINEKLIEQTINEKNTEKYMIIHSISQKNKNIVLNKFENEKYRKNPIIKLFEEEINKDYISHYYIENGNELCHFIYIEDNKDSNENKDLFDLIETKLFSYIQIVENNYNFYDKFYQLFNFYISQMFNNIETKIYDDKIGNIEFILSGEDNLEKKIISSELIFPPENFQLKYLYSISKEFITFNIETETKATKFAGKIDNEIDLNIVKISTIKFDDIDRKNNAFFSNKDSEDKNNIEIRISYDEAIIQSGALSKNNKIKAQNGIISFECPITMNLNQSLGTIHFSQKGDND